ncbi:MAG: alanine racemase, partial [Proteobacteria bacterium]|nr:alanine racemase [Pseudomonadota bacterium]
SFAPSSKIMSVVKADAYGHDMELVATALNKSDGFAVASTEEGIRLRETGLNQLIVLLSDVLTNDELPVLTGYQLSPVIHSLSQVDLLEKYTGNQFINVWLKFDSGMHRLGLNNDEIKQAQGRLQAQKNICIAGVMTHLASADDPADDTTENQLAEYKKLRIDLSEGESSIANSAGIIGWSDSHADWVRPGIMLYGSSPMRLKSSADLDLKPVMFLESQLIAVSRRKAGERIGYGGDWLCEHDTTVGVVAAGYGDGYPRHAPPGTPIAVNGKRVPLIGRVSMDLITVDLGEQATARPGDPVELWGKYVYVDEVALLSNTIAYELFCQVTRRVPRIAID